MKENIVFLTKHPVKESGTVQLRCFNPCEFLSKKYDDVKVQNLYSSKFKKNSILILHRAIADKYTLSLILYAKYRGCIIIYDIDDLLFDTSSDNILRRIGNYTKFDSEQYSKVIGLVDVVTVSTTYLLKKVLHINENVKLMRNGVNQNFLSNFSKPNLGVRKKKYFTLAYLSGSSSHDEDFSLIEDVLFQLLSENSSLKLLLVGPLYINQPKFLGFGDRFEHREFVDYKKYPEIFSEIDINLIPLDTSEDFCHAKSELKYIEAAARSVPSIMSPTETYLEVIEDNVNGVLANDSEWYSALKKYIQDDDARKFITKNAYQHVINDYSPPVLENRWNTFIEELRNKEIFAEQKPSLFIAYISLIVILRAQYFSKMRRFLSHTKKYFLLRFAP